MPPADRWKNPEEWKKHGLDRKYSERSASSLARSKNEEERDWYNKGARQGWLKNFKLKSVTQRGRWKTQESWTEFGIERGYEQKSPFDLQKSESKDEQKWYDKGIREGWTRDFNFTKRRENFTWKDFEQWFDYGAQNNYNERNPTSLAQSTDKQERGWYRNGAEHGWLSDFPFARRKIESLTVQDGQRNSLLEQYIGGQND